jgi:hypothetical protein
MIGKAGALSSRKIREAEAQYSLINQLFIEGERIHFGKARIRPKTAPKREIRAKIGLKSISLWLLGVSPAKSWCCRELGGGIIN